MKNYIVKNVYELPVAYNEWFLVKANSKKEAFNKVYTLYGEGFSKEDFKVFTLDEFYEGEDVAIIH